jgi:photosystem II stability/assembly factor-like uncharacterized protein
VKQDGDATAVAASRLSLVALAAAVGAAVLTVPFAAALISVIRLWDWNFSRFSDDLIGLSMLAWLTLTAVALVLGIVQLLRRGHRRRMPVVAAALGAASLLVIVPLSIAANRSPGFRIEPGPPLAASPGQFVAALEVHGFLVTSTDGGATWDRNVLGASGGLLFPWSVVFSDPQRGWVAGRDPSAVLSTTDGGVNWASSKVRGMSFLNALASSDAQHVWVAGRRTKDLPGVAASADGGVTWTAHAVPGRGALYSIAFPNSRNGWAVGLDTGASGQGYIVATTDGGRHWRTQFRTDSDEMSLGRVTFADARHGWVAGALSKPAGSGADAGVILATDDGGVTWEVRYEARLPLLPVTCTDAMHAWAAGDDGLIIATSDGGKSWREQPSGTSQSLRAISFSDPRHGWILAGREALLATADGGDSWTKVEMGPGVYVIDVAATSAAANSVASEPEVSR